MESEHPTANIIDAMQESYNAGVTDEFMKPIVVTDKNGEAIGKVKEGDVIVFFNFRNDRAKELTIALTQKDMPEIWDENNTIILLYNDSL